MDKITKKKSLVKNKKFLSTDLYNNNNKRNKNQKYSSFNNLCVIGDRSSNQEIHKKNNNLINFIKQKNKFFIENSFDNKGTIEFLASKEIAMRAIKLNDEIIEEQKNNGLTHKNSLNFIDIDIDLRNHMKKNKSTKAAGKGTISPRKSRKNNKKIVSDNQLIKFSCGKLKKHKKDKKVKFENISKKNNNSLIENNNKSPDKENNIIFDKVSNDSQSDIYKFIIDHANEPEENFDKMLKQKLKKVEHSKHNKNKDKKNESRKNMKLPPKRFNSIVFLKNRKSNIFKFSETNKNLMKNDNIDLSSISGESNRNSFKKKKLRRKCGSIQLNNKKIKEKLNQGVSKDKCNNKIISKIDINSDKDSIISILSDLM